MTSEELTKRRRALYAMTGVIVVLTLLIVLAPRSVPRPVKAMACCGDLIAAAFVWLAARQLPKAK